MSYNLSNLIDIVERFENDDNKPKEYWQAIKEIVDMAISNFKLEQSKIENDAFENNTAENWDDFSAMVEDIREYAKNNGRAIVNCDHPAELKIGFVCSNTGKLWKISIAKIRSYAETNENGDLIRRTFATSEGKKNFTDFLNSKE